MSILGNRVLRKEDPKFLTSGGTYVDDLDLEGAGFVTYVRSTMASARITALDVSDAKKAPGVIAVLTAADVDLPPLGPDMGLLNQDMTRPWIAGEVVRFVGEVVAVIVTEERYQGEDAAELVFVDYEPMPTVVDPEEAAKDEVLLFPQAGTNVAFNMQFGRSEDLFDECDVVVRQRIVNQRVAPCPLEVRAGAASWGDDGRLTYWASTQTPHGVRDSLARHLGLDPSMVHVISPDVGGGFGAKIGDYPEEVMLGWIAKKIGRPVRWTETRSESMVALGHGRGQVQDVEIGGTRDGKVTAYRLTVLQDGGAYPKMGCVLPFMTRTMLTGVYDIAKSEFNSTSVVTNTTPTVAYRGAGRPEATAAIERAIDLFALEIGKDPADVRRANLVTKDRFPYTTGVGTTYDIGDYEGALERLLDAADYAELRAEQQRRRDAGDTTQLGLGLSVYVEITAGGGGPPSEFGSVEVKPDGKAVVKTGTSPHGQGHVTAFSMIVADKLGIDLDDIEVIHGDTDLVARGQGTMGSRSIQAGGSAISQASDQVIDQARQLAADLLEANLADVEYDRFDKRFNVIGTPAVSKSWADVAAAAAQQGGTLLAEVDFVGSTPTFPFGAHLAVVEVDTETGRVVVTRMIAVDDAGRILNPLLADGQIHGGLAQGVAQALMEEVRYDPDGNPVTSNLADYAFISAAELPSFERIQMETPTPANDLGAKGIGESGTIGSTPAVQNAVIDALAHLGVRHIEMPTTPERVWRAIGETAS